MFIRKKFLATTIFVDGRRLFFFQKGLTFERPFKGSDFSMYYFSGDDRLS